MKPQTRLIHDFFDVFTKAKRIKADEEKRQKSFGFAVTSIICSLLMIACSFGGAFLFTLTDAGLLYIFLVVIAAILIISVLIEFIGALLRLIVQFSLNRKIMSWIALVVFIAAVGISVYAVVIFIG